MSQLNVCLNCQTLLHCDIRVYTSNSEHSISFQVGDYRIAEKLVEEILSGEKEELVIRICQDRYIGDSEECP